MKMHYIGSINFFFLIEIIPESIPYSIILQYL